MRIIILLSTLVFVLACNSHKKVAVGADEEVIEEAVETEGDDMDVATDYAEEEATEEVEDATDEVDEVDFDEEVDGIDIAEDELEEADEVDEGPRPIEPSIVFGSFYGHCLNNCVTLYKVGPNTYDGMADRSNNLLRKGEDSLNFSDELNKKECEVAQEIRTLIPIDLYDYDGQTFGCPDCADQGGFFIQIIQYSGSVETFRIDTNRDALPEFLKEFPVQVDKLLRRLRPVGE